MRTLTQVAMIALAAAWAIAACKSNDVGST
jgi:hypothetical protein